MAQDTTLGHGAPGIASFASQTYGGPGEPRYGEGVPTTTDRIVSAGADLTLPIYSVVSVINGVLALAAVGDEAGFASGTITIAGTGPADSQTVTIGGVEYTFVTALTDDPATVPYEIVRSDTPATAAANLAAAINGEVGATVSVGTDANPLVSATVDGAVVTVTANQAGTDGNGIEFDSGNAANTTFDPSNDLLAGGTDDMGKRPWGILAHPVSLLNGQSMSVSFYREGHWDMQQLHWDASYVSDQAKKTAFEGSNSPTIFISKKKFNNDQIAV